MRLAAFLIVLLCSGVAHAQTPPSTEYQYDRLHETPLYQSQIDEDAARDAQHQAAENAYLRDQRPMGYSSMNRGN